MHILQSEYIHYKKVDVRVQQKKQTQNNNTSNKTVKMEHNKSNKGATIKLQGGVMVFFIHVRTFFKKFFNDINQFIFFSKLNTIQIWVKSGFTYFFFVINMTTNFFSQSK